MRRRGDANGQLAAVRTKASRGVSEALRDNLRFVAFGLKRNEMSDLVVTKRPWKVQEVKELKRLAGGRRPTAPMIATHL
jgi:hypothetical protein